MKAWQTYITLSILCGLILVATKQSHAQELPPEEQLPTELDVGIIESEDSLFEAPSQESPLQEEVKPESAEEAPIISIENVLPQTEPTKTKITYTWDDFLNGKHCTDADIFNTNDPEISRLILSYCKHPQNDAWKHWLNSFRDIKKEFIIQQIAKENNNFIKYLKIIPYLLFEVHDTAAKGNDFTAQLNQIESAILKRDTAQAVRLIETINNDSLKLALHPILNEGKNLLKIQQGLSLNKEATND